MAIGPSVTNGVTGPEAGDGLDSEQPMPINFRCTSCTARLYAPKRTAGTSIECPKCGRRVIVPAPSAWPDPARFEERDVERRIGAIGNASEEIVRLQDATGWQRPAAGSAAGRAVGWPFLDRYPFVPAWLVWAQGACIALAALAGFAVGLWWARGG